MPILFDNCRRRFKYVFITGFFCLFHIALMAQPGALQTQLLQYSNGADSLVNSYSPEKVYLQFDKPYYAIKDTMWMKAYLLNAASLLPAGRSGLLHIDISNDSGKLVKQYLLSLTRGTGAGEISLDEGDFKTGTYTLCAYTNWMRNFGTETFFYKSFNDYPLVNTE